MTAFCHTDERVNVQNAHVCCIVCRGGVTACMMCVRNVWNSWWKVRMRARANTRVLESGEGGRSEWYGCVHVHSLSVLPVMLNLRSLFPFARQRRQCTRRLQPRRKEVGVARAAYTGLAGRTGLRRPALRDLGVSQSCPSLCRSAQVPSSS